MDTLTKKRNSQRKQLTTLITECEGLMAAEKPDYVQLQAVYNVITLKYEEINQMNEKIVDLMICDKDVDEDILNEEYTESEKYIRSFMVLKTKLETPQLNPNSTRSAYGDDNKKTSLKLPKFEIKKFSGDLKEWLGFWSQFQSIDESEELHPADKFHYLMQSVEEGSRASDVVSSYPRSADNYPKAIQALKDRYGNNELLVEVYVRELLKLVINNVQSKGPVNISKLYDQLESHLRALESLGVTSDKYDAMLFPMVESCLPVPVLRAWQRSPLSKPDVSKDVPPRTRLCYLMEFLSLEVESEQRISLACEGFGMKKENNKKQDKKKESVETEGEKYPATTAGLVSSEKTPTATTPKANTCVFCGKMHSSTECYKAQALSRDEKIKLLKEGNRCQLCFRSHQRPCKAFVKCFICGQKHQTLMCLNLPSHAGSSNAKENNDDEPEKSTSNSGFCGNSGENTEVMLQTVMLTVRNGGKEKKVRALFDTGSQRSHILKTTVKELGYQCEGSELITHVLFGGVENEVHHKRYHVQLENLDGTFTTQMNALDQNKICGKLPSVSIGKWMQDLKQKRICLHDVGTQDNTIEILIGADLYGKLQTGNIHQLQCGLTAVETKLGWTVMGVYTQGGKKSSSMLVTSLLCEVMTVSELWSLETIGIRDPVDVQCSKEKDILVKEEFFKTITQLPKGQYVVPLPWSNGKLNIPNNRFVAEKRLQSTTKKLVQMGKFDAYQDVFNEWLTENIIEEVKDDPPEICHFLPHRPVFKEESSTTKVRPVFDGSCKVGRAPSINDCLHKGPNLIDLIPAVIHRFREFRYGVVSDIRKAFLTIGLDKESCDYLLFMWWESKTCEKIKIYRHLRVVFGLTCSPFLLAAVIDFHLKKYKGIEKKVANKLAKSLYVDNNVASVASQEELDEYVTTSTRIMKEAGMDLRLWQDSLYVQENMEDRFVQVLGLQWDRWEDTLQCVVKIPSGKDSVFTKRSLLSSVMGIFDPLGILCPTTLIPKVMLQETWLQKKGWDEPLEEQTCKKFSEWLENLHFLSMIKIPRWCDKFSSGRKSWSIHTFCDASSYAYAAVCFLRSEKENTTTVELLQGKTRVAPLHIVAKHLEREQKPPTIPRLELLACEIAVRLAKSVQDAFGWENIPMLFWSDSSTALAWIRRNDNWGTFVGNRVCKILELSTVEQWRHVPGKMNPADLPSRGCNAEQLLNSQWFRGPSWLYGNPSTWPGKIPEPDENLVVCEKRKTTNVAVNLICQERPWFMIRTSGYEKIIRQMSYVLRVWRKIKKLPIPNGDLTREEIEITEHKLWKIVQMDCFENSNKTWRELDIFKDECGMIRVKTKILLREDSFDFRCPILLPTKHPLVVEMIREVHLKNCHAGSQFLVSFLRERFWILQTRKAVNAVINKCARCNRFSAKRLETAPAPLPIDRVRDATAFEVVGVDLAGPLFLKERKKAWMVLYTCAVYRGVHLELVTSLDTEHFLQSFRRFIARRGRPRVIFSDNGTNFKGAVNLFRAVDWCKIKKIYLMEPITWKFNPPAAPWWGGFFERMIRSVKSMLVRMLGKSSLSYEELLTALCDVEAVINSRPLTYVTENGQDLVPLTPAMFMQGTTESRVPEIDEIDKCGFQKRFRYRQMLMENLRQRFRREYLGMLVNNAKDKAPGSIFVGDVVLIENDMKKRQDWNMGRVVQLLPGGRVAKVKTEHGELTRAVQRLFPLECSREPPTSHQTRKHVLKSEDKPVEKVEPVVRTRSGRLIKKPSKM